MKMNSTGGSLSGYYTVGFDGEKFQLGVNATSAECEAGWESLANIQDVTCTATQEDRGIIYTVEFDSFPPLPYQNNIFVHYGNPGLTSFSCDISQVIKTNILSGYSNGYIWLYSIQDVWFSLYILKPRDPYLLL